MVLSTDLSIRLIKRAQARPLEILDPCNGFRLGARAGQPEAPIDQTAAGLSRPFSNRAGICWVLQLAGDVSSQFPSFEANRDI
jgi:hypothetical protein